MITLRKLGEAVQRTLTGGSTKAELKITLQDAMLAAAQARDSYIFQIITANKADEVHSFPFDILSEFKLTVSDSSVSLPKRGLSLLKHNSGIYLVTADLCGGEVEVLPRKAGAKTLYSGQWAQALENRPYYWPISQKLNVTGLSDGCVVTVLMVAAGEEFTPDEFFPVPPEAQDQVIKMAIERLGVMAGVPEDKITDSTES